MPALRHLSFKDGDVLLLIGTVKGAFLARRRAAAWAFGGPYFAGQSVYAMAYDGRAGRHRVWAGAESAHFGALLRSTDDFGRKWTEPKEATLRFPKDTGLALERIWQILPGRESEPAVLYCGVAPAALFVSQDNGHTWGLVRGLHDHPHRVRWNPGGGRRGCHRPSRGPTGQGSMGPRWPTPPRAGGPGRLP